MYRPIKDTIRRYLFMEKCNLFCTRAADFAQVLSMKFFKQTLSFVNISEIVFLCVMLDFSSAGDCEGEL